ncbi:MAG: Lar family restriction alleviation protein [Bacteroidaceae bacterium]|nr:Lar family restriction alleviation protein [Bacteroidaceae bacterium]
MSKSTKLKPCPFCGGKPRRYEGKIDGHGIACSKCSLKMYGYASKGAATRAWNKRPVEDELEAAYSRLLSAELEQYEKGYNTGYDDASAVGEKDILALAARKQSEINRLQKSNRNWRRKVQRLRATKEDKKGNL